MGWAVSSSSCIYTEATTTKKPATWAKNTKKHCFSSKHPTKYATLAKEQEACVKLGSQCSGVYDNGCDNKDEFYTCTTAKWAVSSSSCIYTPPKATTTKKPTTTTKKPTTTTKKSLWTKNTKKHCFSSKHPTKYAT